MSAKSRTLIFCKRRPFKCSKSNRIQMQDYCSTTVVIAVDAVPRLYSAMKKGTGL